MADKNKKGYNPKGIFGPEGFFGRMIDEQSAKQRAKKIEQNRKNLSKKKTVSGFDTYKPTDTTGGMFKNIESIAPQGALKVTPGNIGGSSYKTPKVPDILKGVGGQKIDPYTQSTTPNIPNKPDLKVGTGPGNAYYPATQKYKDNQRKETARKARDIKQPRRIHEATRMAQELLKRPTK